MDRTCSCPERGNIKVRLSMGQNTTPMKEEVQQQAFLSSGLDGGEQWASRYGAHCTGGWMGLRGGLHTEVETRNSFLCRETNPSRRQQAYNPERQRK
jgi:hypothetical protein